MKRTLIVLVFSLLVLACTFAEVDIDIVAKVSPYSLQTVRTAGGTYVSDYGYGIAGGFRADVWNNVTAGLDLNIGFFKFDELDKDYIVVSFRGTAGYRYDFTEKLYANADLGLGLDLRKVGSVKNTSFGLNLYMGCGYRLSDEFALTGGLDLALCFQTSKKSSSTDFALRTQLGLAMAL